MAIKGFEWIGPELMALFVIGMITTALSLGFAELSLALSVLVTTSVGVFKGLFNKYQHKLGLEPNSFKRLDVVAAMMGGAVVATAMGLIELVKIIF